MKEIAIEKVHSVRHRSVLVGITASTAMAAFYVIVLGWASGFDHLTTQAGQDWPFLLGIIGGFGIQAGLTSELRSRHRLSHLEHAASTGGAAAGGAGMVACCAHHIADLLPLVGASGAAAFLTGYRIPLMLIGITINAIGIALVTHQLRRTSLHRGPGRMQWHAA